MSSQLKPAIQYIYILLILCICVVDILHTKLLAAEALKLTGHWVVHRLVGEK